MIPIDIKKFDTVFTNGDMEDIPESYFAELKNLRPVPGGLEKTFGIGDETNIALQKTAKSFFVFVDEHLLSGKQMIAVHVDPATRAATIYSYFTQLGWGVSSIFNGFYHKDDINPIVQDGGILRILPGNTGTPDGTNEAKGIWYSYIDRKFFDDKYAPAADFKAYPTCIEAPNLSLTTALLNNGPFNSDGNGETKWYKFSHIYDGVQESLLNAHPIKMEYGQNQLGKFSFDVTSGAHNRRITALKVYRSDTKNGPFEHIQTVDFLRKSAGAFRNESGGAWTGRYKIHIPALSTYNFNDEYSYRLFLDGTEYYIDAPSGSGHDTFSISASGPNQETVTDHWDVEWTLQHDPGGGTSFVTNPVEASGSSGAYAGEHVVITETDMSGSDLKDRYLLYDETYWRNVVDNGGKAVKFDTSESNLGTDKTEKTWAVLRDSSGVYFVDDNQDGTLTYTFFDRGFLAGAEHPLAGEVSIKANGKYAKIINGRMVLANIVLDPGGANEAHEDWIVYSELGQYDVFPASNVIKIEDHGGGPITGLGELHGNIVIAKRNSVTRIDSERTPDNPAFWVKRKTKHNIGNIAPNGFIEVLNMIYICSFDGIYQLSASNIADSDEVPIEFLRISEIINDQYLALSESEKENTVVGYDQRYGEVVFIFGKDS